MLLLTYRKCFCWKTWLWFYWCWKP